MELWVVWEVLRFSSLLLLLGGGGRRSDQPKPLSNPKPFRGNVPSYFAFTRRLRTQGCWVKVSGLYHKAIRFLKLKPIFQ